jgi:hypothetical protein
MKLEQRRHMSYLQIELADFNARRFQRRLHAANSSDHIYMHNSQIDGASHAFLKKDSLENFLINSLTVIVKEVSMTAHILTYE